MKPLKVQLEKFMPVCAWIVVTAFAFPQQLTAAVNVPPPLSGIAVSTIAGSGLQNVQDGAALAAGFLLPAGLAFDRAGVLYIADMTGQRIKRLRGGIVTTIAGSGAVDSRTGTVPGGYRDGPGNIARFRRPIGLAVDAAGSLYVADSANHVIRRIANGIVSTFAGRADDGSGQDGPAATASFGSPTAISFGDDGTLYVADADIGLRSIARDGVVRTLAKAAHVSGVAVWGKGDGTIVFWSDSQSLHRLILASGADEVIGSSAGGSWEGMTPTRNPFQLVALSADDVAFTDIVSNSVRYYRRAMPPFSQSLLIRSLIGDDQSDVQNSGGYRDGPAADARANEPIALARAPDGSLVFSDAGNGRIRRITGFNPRHFIGPDMSGLPDAADGSYHIVYVSNSYAFYDTLWANSIAGVLEKRLNSDAPLIGLKRHVRVDVVRLDGSPLSGLLDFSTRLLGDTGANAIVIGVNVSVIVGGDVIPRPVVIPDLQQTQKMVHDTDATLRARGIKLYVVVHPSAYEASPAERLYAKSTDDFADTDADFETLVRITHLFSDAGVDTLSAEPAFAAYDGQESHFPLFASADHHFSDAGNAVLGNFIAEALERERPWSRQGGH